MTSRYLNTYCDVTQCMNGLWIFITKTWIAQGRFININRTPSKQWGMCDKVLLEKGGDREKLKNYRGVPLQSCVGKLYGKILGSRLFDDAEAVGYIATCSTHLGKGRVQWRLCIFEGKLSMPGEWKRMILSCLFRHMESVEGGWLVVKCLNSSRDSMMIIKVTSG